MVSALCFHCMPSALSFTRKNERRHKKRIDDSLLPLWVYDAVHVRNVEGMMRKRKLTKIIANDKILETQMHYNRAASHAIKE